MNKTLKGILIGILAVFLFIGAMVFFFKPEEPEPTAASISEQIEYEQAFVDGCIEGGGTRSFCQCGWDYLIEEYGFNKVIDISAELIKTGDIPSEMVEATEFCY